MVLVGFLMFVVVVAAVLYFANGGVQNELGRFCSACGRRHPLPYKNCKKITGR